MKSGWVDKSARFWWMICVALSVLFVGQRVNARSCQPVITEDDKEEGYSDKEKIWGPIVEQMPQFPGGDEALMNYIASNLQYPLSAYENGIQGRVQVRFVVEKDGSVSDVSVLRGIDPALDDEAVRLIKSLPKFKPAMQNGVPVAVYYNVPILFRLASEKEQKTKRLQGRNH